LGEAQRGQINLQDLRYSVLQNKQERDDKDLFDFLSDGIKETERQEQKQGNSKRYTQKIHREGQGEVAPISKGLQKNSERKRNSKKVRGESIKEDSQANESSLTQGIDWNKEEANKRAVDYHIKHGKEMCCVQCGKNLDHRPYSSIIERGDKSNYKSASTLSEVQFNEARQNNGRVFDILEIGVKGIDSLFGETIISIPQPKDKGILLKDILESDVDAKYFLSQQRIETMLKGERSVPHVDEETKKFNYLISGYNKIPTDEQYVVHNTMPRSGNPEKGGTGHLTRSDGKTYCLDTSNVNAVEIQCVAMRGREAILTPKRTEYGKAIRKDYEAGNIEAQRKNIQQLEPRTDNKTNTLTSVQKDNLVMQLNPSTESNGCQPFQQNRIYDSNGISPALMAQMSSGTHAINHERTIRRLTPLECERLQTVRDGYTSIASDSQRYRMLGNGWTIDVISHILSYMKQ
jgi:site-specific DNA-cytosine methylase